MAVPGSGGEEEDKNSHRLSARAVTHSLGHRNLSLLVVCPSGNFS